MIREATATDASAVAAIYNHYIEQTTITFETAPVSETQVAERIAAVQRAGYPWLVCDEGGVVGYAYATQLSPRAAYAHSAEATVYLDPAAGGRGRGTALYRALLARLRAGGAHTVIGVIALPNPASVALHERIGMRKVGHLAQVGHKFGRWIDVGYWQMGLGA